MNVKKIHSSIKNKLALALAVIMMLSFTTAFAYAGYDTNNNDDVYMSSSSPLKSRTTEVASMLLHLLRKASPSPSDYYSIGEYDNSADYRLSEDYYKDNKNFVDEQLEKYGKAEALTDHELLKMFQPFGICVSCGNNPCPQTFNVVFVVQNGPVGVYTPHTATIQVDCGEEISPSAMPVYGPTRRGWEFVGWYKGEPTPGSIPISHPTAHGPVTENLTFTARFNQLWWDITFIVEEGGVNEGTTVHTERDGFRLPGHHWGTPSLPTIPSTEAHPGWRFVGWDVDPSTVPFITNFIDFTGNHTFTAKFEPFSPTIAKTAYPAYPTTVLPGDDVTYTITIDTDGLCRDTFLNHVSIADPLDTLLTLDTASISVTGLDSWICNSDSNQLDISDMVLSSCPANDYATQVVITFTATVSENAQSGSIPNTAELHIGWTPYILKANANVTVALPQPPPVYHTVTFMVYSLAQGYDLGGVLEPLAAQGDTVIPPIAVSRVRTVGEFVNLYPMPSPVPGYRFSHWEMVRYDNAGNPYRIPIYNGYLISTLVGRDIRFIAVFEPIEAPTITESGHDETTNIPDTPTPLGRSNPQTGDSIINIVIMLISGVSFICSIVALLIYHKKIKRTKPM